MWAGYAALKAVHVGSVATSLALFVVRGIWMLTASEYLALRWVRVVPRGVRSSAFVGALATFAYIVSVVVTKSPAGFLEGL